MTEKREARLRLLTETDGPLWETGISFAGMDEAGRGPLAGNVVAACVMMPPEPLLPWVDDSKKLSAARRDNSRGTTTPVAGVGDQRHVPQVLDKVFHQHIVVPILEPDPRGMKSPVIRG